MGCGEGDVVRLNTGSGDLEVVVDVSATEVDPGGHIVGEVWLRHGPDGVPACGFRDRPVVVLRWWLAELRKLLKQQSQDVSFVFTDMRHRVDIKQVGRHSTRMQAIRIDGGRETIRGAYLVRIDHLARSVIFAADRVIAHSHEKRWTQGVAELERGLDLARSTFEEVQARSRTAR
jgi:hypothetical protein